MLVAPQNIGALKAGATCPFDGHPGRDRRGLGCWRHIAYGNWMKIPKSKRARRVSVEIQKIVAESVRRKASRFAPGTLVSVPEVRVSDDLMHANLYVSILGVEDPSSIQRELLKLLPSLRKEVAKTMRIRKVPEFRMTWDDTAEYADRIEQLLSQISPEDETDESDTDNPSDEGERGEE